MNQTSRGRIKRVLISVLILAICIFTLYRIINIFGKKLAQFPELYFSINQTSPQNLILDFLSYHWFFCFLCILIFSFIFMVSKSEVIKLFYLLQQKSDVPSEKKVLPLFITKSIYSILAYRYFPYNYLMWVSSYIFIEAARFKSTNELYFIDYSSQHDLIFPKLSPLALALLCMVILPLLIFADRIWLVKFLMKKSNARGYLFLGLCLSLWFSYCLMTKASEFTLSMNGVVFLLPLLTLTISFLYNLISGLQKLRQLNQ